MAIGHKIKGFFNKIGGFFKRAAKKVRGGFGQAVGSIRKGITRVGEGIKKITKFGVDEVGIVAGGVGQAVGGVIQKSGIGRNVIILGGIALVAVFLLSRGAVQIAQTPVGNTLAQGALARFN